MTSSAAGSRFGRWYEVIYDRICGRHPNLRPWHFQWLDARPLYGWLRRVLPRLGGGSERIVLDVGCGAKPYRSWFGPVRQYTGIDVFPGPEVDIVVAPNARWPFGDAAFDVVLCSQVLEHVEHLQHTVSEISRVLKPSGRALISVPFLYNEHGAPFDFRRLTVHGVRLLFADLRVETLAPLGGVGSTIAILFLNWWDQALTRTYSLRLLKALLLPATIVVSAALNLIALMLDSIDKTQSFYSNILVIVSKEGQMGPASLRA
jgi:SAM-dependent methyltransferase